MHFSTVLFLSFIALTSGTPASLYDDPNLNHLSTRQSFGNCRVSGRGGLDVFLSSSHTLGACLSVRRAPEHVAITLEAHV